MKLSGNKILITGGATGIGLGLTQRFLEENNKVIICGRRKDVLEQVCKQFPGVEYFVCDLTEEQSRIALFEWIQDNHPDLNVLINNAGIQNWMQLSDPDFYSRSLTEITSNIIAPIHLTQLFLQMKSLNTLMNVASGLSFVPLAKTPVYSATKAFIHSYTLSLQYLLKEKGVEVIEIVPPALNTDLGGKGIHDAYPPVSDFIEAIFKQLIEGKSQLTFGFSEVTANGTPEQIKAVFERLNP